MKLISLSPFVSLILTAVLALSPVYGQSTLAAANAPASDAASPQMLQLRVTDTDNSQPQTGSHTSKGFTVQVTDASGAPVSDAAVTFRLPDNDPTGVFADGRHSAVVYTDTAGYATVRGIQWGETPGLAAIRVTATKGTSHAGMLIQQTLTSRTAAAIPAAPRLVSSTTVAVEPATPQPVQPATAQAVAKAIDPTPHNIPVAQSSATPDATPQAEKSVSVTSASPGEAPHRSHAKWFVIAAVAAAAGVGVAMAGKGKSGTSNSAAPSLSIGAPTISVGQPH